MIRNGNVRDQLEKRPGASLPSGAAPTTGRTGSRWMPDTEKGFRAKLPRLGKDLSVEQVRPDGRVVISDGKRSAVYEPMSGEPVLSGAKLEIVPANVEAGGSIEANVVTLTDGSQHARYEPVEVIG